MGAKTVLSLEEFLRLEDDETQYELDEGELVPMSPTNRTHGRVVRNAFRALDQFLQKHPLGELNMSDVGFVLTRDPVIVRAPDVSFVRSERLAGTDPNQFFPGAPDLAVVVASPSDTVSRLRRKVQQYLHYGAQMVWAVYPETQEVEVHDASGAVILGLTGTLEAPALLPGFSLPVAALFE